jgi:hypothetical protein
MTNLKPPDTHVLVDIVNELFDFNDHEGSYQKIKAVLDEQGYDTSELRESLFGPNYQPEPESKPAISESRVEELFLSCLTGGDNYIKLEGILADFGLDKDVLEANREEITDLVKKLPGPFRASEGGGWTFLKGYRDYNGVIWTEKPAHIEQIMLLGMGIGLIEYCLPRDLWSLLPQKVPYFRIKL